MNEFARKWQTCADHARRAPAPDSGMPWGFANRVLSQWPATSPASLVSVWLQWGWRAFTGVALVLLVGAVLEYRSARQSSVFMPHVEDTVAQVFWML